MGWDEEGTVDMMRRKKVVGPDGVHLSVQTDLLLFPCVTGWLRRR